MTGKLPVSSAPPFPPPAIQATADAGLLSARDLPAKIGSSRLRVPWIDFYRGAAVLVMFEVHVINTFLSPVERSANWFALLNYLNGLVAPSFLFIAGFVQGTASNARRGSTPDYGRRLRRLAGIAAIGYALHFPWQPLWQHRWDVAARVGFQVDVLQCLAASLGLLSLVDWTASQMGPQRAKSAWWIGAGTLLVLAVIPAPFAAAWNAWPVPLRAWINFSTGSWFPLFPWAGFVFLGSLAGAALQIRRDEAPKTRPSMEADPSVALAFSSGPNPATASIFPAVPIFIFAPLPLAISASARFFSEYSPVSLSSFFERAAWVLALAGFCQWLSAHRLLPKLVLVAGQQSLALYISHLLIISALVAIGAPEQSLPLSAVIALLVAVVLASLTTTWVLGNCFRWARAFRR